MQINWGLQDPNAFQRGFDQVKGPIDQAMAQQKVQMQENALRQYAMNPNDPAGLNALAQADPRLAIQARQEMARTAATERKTQAELSEASRANVIKGAQIIRQAQPKDQAGWDQVLQMAQVAGIDISTVPRQFDPQFAQNMTQLADTFEPVKAEASPYQFIPYQPGGGVLRADKRLGTTTELVRPNDDPSRTGAPVKAAPPAVLTDDDIRRLEGGQASPTPGNFR